VNVNCRVVKEERMARLMEEIALVFLQANTTRGMLKDVLQRIPALVEGASMIQSGAAGRRKILEEIQSTDRAKSGILNLLLKNSEEPPGQERAARLQKKGC